MKIYFAGSIFGGRNDVHIYEQIIKLLKKYGSVLTEHVGDKTYVALGVGGVPADEYIYQRDTKWLGESDVLIAEVTTVSMGVGYEIGYAEKLGKKILCLWREDAEKKLSFMISGNKNLTVKTYKTIEDLPEIFNNFFK